MKKIIPAYLILLLLISSMSFAWNKEDILEKILNEVGFNKADIGFYPRGYWSRFPLDIPHKLTSFDALLAEPFKLYDYATVMSNAMETYLDPAFTDTNATGLYKLVYHLGVDKKLGGFRDYSANLIPAPTGEEPLVTAFEKLFALADREMEFYTFGGKSAWPDLKKDIRAMTSKLPDTVKTILAEIIVNLTDAIRWRNLAFRNCDTDDMQKAFDIRDLSDTQGDGMVYYHVLDDIARTIDWPSLHYAALKTAAVAEKAERALIKFKSRIPDDFEMEIPTPFGKIAVFSPVFLKDKKPTSLYSSIRAPIPGWLEYEASNSLLIIDFGRNLIYQGTPGATASLSNPISVVIDLDGDDYYGYGKNIYPPSTGVGLLGVGVVIDSRGNDHYHGSTYAQGAGLFGVGVLFDREGNDQYKADLSAQGAGYFGIGLCLDGTGDDRYYLYGDGQGMGGVGGGVGVLASFGGRDEYIAEPYAEVFNRGDYHSEMKINGNNAQGAGFGRRGDGSDGHAWAGGLGVIIDIHGDDHYYSGNWTLGVGYWFGTGIALDKNGDDFYESCYFTQGSGAHYCNGILIDENGNDRHELYETSGAAFGFGWDYTNAFLINKNGNDIYRAKIISMGLAQIRSNAFLIDIGGDDRYYLGENTPGLGEATFREDYSKPGRLSAYNSYAKSFGGFIDIGGTDTYFTFNKDKEYEHPVAKNNFMWFTPNKGDSTYGANNYGVGIDIEEGTIPELLK